VYLFNYDSENQDAVQYGKFYWGVILTDGRYMYFHADKVVVDGGSLVAMREIARPNEHDGDVQVTLSIAHGHWMSFFAANIVTGEPVCVDNTKAIKG
jgi:hypothetical protein